MVKIKHKLSCHFELVEKSDCIILIQKFFDKLRMTTNKKSALFRTDFVIYIFLVRCISNISAITIAAKLSTIGTALGTTQGS